MKLVEAPAIEFEAPHGGIRGALAALSRGTYTLLSAIGGVLLDRPSIPLYAGVVVVGALLPPVSTFILIAVFCAAFRRHL